MVFVIIPRYTINIYNSNRDNITKMGETKINLCLYPQYVITYFHDYFHTDFEVNVADAWSTFSVIKASLCLINE